MEVINFDSDSKHRKTRDDWHYLLPDCHYLLVGPTGCGKTSLLCTMLLKWINPDEVTIYTINPDQYKYNLLQEFNELLLNDMYQIADPEEVIPIEDLDCETSKMIVFDDIKIDG